MKKPILVSLNLSSQLIQSTLNALTLVASTAPWSSRFYLDMTLFEKKYLRLSRVHLSLTSLIIAALTSFLADFKVFTSAVVYSANTTVA